MEKLFQFYEENLGGNYFYSTLKNKTNESPNLYNQSMVHSNVNKISYSVHSDFPKVNNGDIRIDMPILCGNIKSQRKILFLGLEPRHRDDTFNIMKIGNRVFATPFGIDKWYSKSKQSVYACAFEKYLKLDALFLFSDFVKEYKVYDPKQKSLNDEKARTNFKNIFSEKYQTILEKEIEIFEPTIIIGLGKKDINKKVDKQWLKQYDINIISHPIRGNFNRMQSELSEILK
jgi:hypothetical protein